MSDATSSSQSIQLAFRSQGRGRHTVTARHGDEVVHLDTFDVSAAAKRQTFLNKVRSKAAGRQLTVDLDGLEQQLLQQADPATNVWGARISGSGGAMSADIMSADAMPTGSVPDLEPAGVLRAFGIEVLGQLDDQSIMIYATSTKRCWCIKRIGQWSELDMAQALGTATSRLWIHRSPPPEGMYNVQHLQLAVALTAAQAGKYSRADMLGQGVYRRGNRLLIVNGNQAVTYDGQRFRGIRGAKVGNSIIEFDRNKRWARRLVPRVRRMNNASAAISFVRLHELLAQWFWRHPTDAFVATGLILATWVQACWTWRPLVHVTGESNAGKSTLFVELLKPLFGDWALLIERATEAAIRQAIGHDACPVCIDEFDDYRHRDQVCELFRTAGRGGIVIRGTADQTGRSFRVNHLPWFAAVESGGKWSQDRNRRIRLELLIPENRSAPVLPSAEEVGELGQELAAAAIWAAPSAIPLADSIKRTRIPGVPERLVESFSVPAAMCAVMCYGRDATEAQAVELLQAMLSDRQALESQAEPEQQRLLQDIMSSVITVPVPSGTMAGTWTVAQLLGTRDFSLSSLYLEPRGVRLLRRRDADPGAMPDIFLVPETVQRELLRGTRWANVDLAQILERLPGARREQQRCGGQRPWGIAMPWPASLGCLGGQDAPQDNPSP